MQMIVEMNRGVISILILLSRVNIAVYSQIVISKAYYYYHRSIISLIGLISLP